MVKEHPESLTFYMPATVLDLVTKCLTQTPYLPTISRGRNKAQKGGKLMFVEIFLSHQAISKYFSVIFSNINQQFTHMESQEMHRVNKNGENAQQL